MRTPPLSPVQPVLFLSISFEVWFKCTRSIFDSPDSPTLGTSFPKPNDRLLCLNSLVQMEYLGVSPLATFLPSPMGRNQIGSESSLGPAGVWQTLAER